MPSDSKSWFYFAIAIFCQLHCHLTKMNSAPSANPSRSCEKTDCGWGILNPWTCRCDCAGTWRFGLMLIPFTATLATYPAFAIQLGIASMTTASVIYRAPRPLTTTPLGGAPPAGTVHGSPTWTRATAGARCTQRSNLRSTVPQGNAVTPTLATPSPAYRRAKIVTHHLHG